MQKNAFTNAIVIITGAASGIGQQLCLQAAQRGAQVIGADINEQGLQETQNLAKTQNLNIQTHRLDVGNATDIEQFAAQILPTLNNQKLILINNAGVALASGHFEHTNLTDFEWLLNINLWGVIRMTKAFYPYFIAQQQGHIVNISSVFGLAGISSQSAYCTAKFGVRGFTETLRMELAGTNIHTTCVHPGGVKTNIAKNAPAKGSFITNEMQKKGVESFEKVAQTTAHKAAQLILDAIEKRKKRLVIGLNGYALDWLTRLLPVAYTSIIEKQLNKTFDNPYKKQ